jgi:chemotaxis protein methyltransferase CheR
MATELKEIEEFRDKIEAEFGLVFDVGRKEQVEEALLTRRTALELSSRDYLSRLDTDRGEWGKVAALLTVPESYFFRHADHLRAFIEVAVPERMAAHPEDRMLRILCVGCAQGEEPYTLSMNLLEHADLVGSWKAAIRGCDINPEALRQARRGTYTNWALRATPPACKARYFASVGNRHRIADEVRSGVSFEVCNVLSLYRPEFAESFDIIFFRNVLIYFGPEAIRAAVNTLAHMLAPGGYLFLGPAETLRGVSDDFSLCHTHETFYYRRKASIGELKRFSPLHREPRPGSATTAQILNSDLEGMFPSASAADFQPSIPASPPDTRWMEEIESSSERILRLHTRVSRTGARHAAPVKRRPAKQLSKEDNRQLFSLLSEGRYQEILALTGNLSADFQDDSDILLLRALAHLNRKELANAEAVCRTALKCDSMNASGHYVLALCREHTGDIEGAMEQDRISIYLDPTFAIPHMHLALIARKGGDRRSARREFEKADLLLARENAGRLMMFGGGFSREALQKLCRSELRALGPA